MTPLRIAVIGLIGSGKSTLCKELTKEFGENSAAVVDEPVDIWMQDGFLQAFYAVSEARKENDPTRILLSALFQSNVLNTRVSAIAEANKKHLDKEFLIFDSHPLADLAFMSLTPDLVLPEAELKLNKWYAGLLQRTLQLAEPMPDIFIFMDTPIDICMRNIRERSRESEDKIPRLYMERLQHAFKNIVVPSIKNTGAVFASLNCDGTDEINDSIADAIKHINDAIDLFSRKRRTD